MLTADILHTLLDQGVRRHSASGRLRRHVSILDTATSRRRYSLDLQKCLTSRAKVGSGACAAAAITDGKGPRWLQFRSFAKTRSDDEVAPLADLPANWRRDAISSISALRDLGGAHHAIAINDWTRDDNPNSNFGTNPAASSE